MRQTNNDEKVGARDECSSSLSVPEKIKIKNKTPIVWKWPKASQNSARTGRSNGENKGKEFREKRLEINTQSSLAYPINQTKLDGFNFIFLSPRP